MTVLDQNIAVVPTETISPDGSELDDDTIPIVIVGLSSMIIVCAFVVYLRDQSHGSITKRQESAELGASETDNDKQMHDIGSSAGSATQDSSGYWVNTTDLALLPPMNGDEEQPSTDVASIAQVSTLTQSVVDNHYRGNIEDAARTMETSSQVTELSDENLVSVGTALSSLVLRRSDSASLTSREDYFEEDEEGFELLLGESCLDEEESSYSPSSSPLGLPFEYTPSSDDASMLSKHSLSQMELSQVEQLIAASAGAASDIDELSSAAASMVLRDIYFVPGENSGSEHGLYLVTGKEYPTVSSVDPSSSFMGRVFLGDFLLAINGTDLTNKTAEEAMGLLNSGSAVMVTVKSAEYDEASEIGTQVGSVDLGALVEV